MRVSFKTGFIAGYIAALGTCFAALVRLAYAPPSKWWPKR